MINKKEPEMSSKEADIQRALGTLPMGICHMCNKRIPICDMKEVPFGHNDVEYVKICKNHR